MVARVKSVGLFWANGASYILHISCSRKIHHHLCIAVAAAQISVLSKPLSPKWKHNETHIPPLKTFNNPHTHTKEESHLTVNQHCLTISSINPSCTPNFKKPRFIPFFAAQATILLVRISTIHQRTANASQGATAAVNPSSDRPQFAKGCALEEGPPNQAYFVCNYRSTVCNEYISES
jgi:hypothetical protein